MSSTMQLIFFVNILIHHTWSNIIDCQHGCTGIVSCNKNEDCHILCTSPSSCNHATFVCPSNNYNCFAECSNNNIDGSSCLGTIFDAEYSNNFKLIVNTKELNNVWSAGMVKCPTNGICNIHCNGKNTHGGVCQHNQIYAVNSNSLIINANGNWPIWDFHIYCPDETDGNCEINVENGTGLLDDMRIFSKNGITNINIVCNENECYTKYHEPRLECNDNNECLIIPFSKYNNKWLCSDKYHVCNSNQITNIMNNMDDEIKENNDDIKIFKHTKLDIIQTELIYWVLLIIVALLMCLFCVVTALIVHSIRETQKNTNTNSNSIMISEDISTSAQSPSIFNKNNIDNHSITSETSTMTYSGSDINAFAIDMKQKGQTESFSYELDCVMPITKGDFNDLCKKFEEGHAYDQGEFSIILKSNDTYSDTEFPSHLPNLPIERHHLPHMDNGSNHPSM